MRQELKFKLEEESTKNKELKETCAKIRDASSALEILRQCTVVIAIKEITQFDRTC